MKKAVINKAETKNKKKIKVKKMNRPYTIIRDTNNKIEKIFHISDIHIGNGRYAEFRLIFDRLFNIIRKKVGKNKNKCLIVVTGDIIDSWNLLPEAKELLNDFYTQATSITSCVSIPGNHEYKGVESSYKNPLFPLIDQNFNTGNDNRSYTIAKGGLYLYDNVIFGLTTPFADKVTECKVNSKGMVKIGLYHGTVHNAINHQKFKFTDEEYFCCDDFSDYDYVMLGDIHKEQSLNKEKTIRYPGSLIQLKKSEAPDHGFIMWEILKGKSTFIKVPNDKVQICIDEEDDLNKLNLKKYNGKTVEITISHRSMTDKKKINRMKDKIQKKLNMSDVSYESNVDYSDTKVNMDMNVDGNKRSLLKISSKEDAIDFTLKYMKKLYKKDKMNKIKKMLKRISNDVNYDGASSINNIRVKKLSFNNMFIYGTDNKVDFTKFNGLVGLNSGNATGKSSLIDTLCLSIYGKQSRGSEDMKSALKRGELELSTDVTLSVNKVNYRIVRRYKRSGTNYMKFGTCGITIYKKGKEIKSYDKSTGWVTANKYIEDNICSYDDFVNHFVILQKVNTGFTAMGKERGNYLLDVFKLDLFREFSKQITNEKKRISTRYAAIANNLVEIGAMKKGASRRVKDKKKLMTDVIKTATDDIKRLDKDIKEYNKREDTLRKELKDKEKLMSNLDDYIDRYGSIDDMDNLLEKKIQLSDDIKEIRRSIKRSEAELKFMVSREESLKRLTDKIVKDELCGGLNDKMDRLNSMILSSQQRIMPRYKIKRSEDELKDMLEIKNSKSEEFRKSIEGVYDKIKKSGLGKKRAVDMIEKYSYGMADDMVEINSIKSDLELHRQNRMIDVNNRIAKESIKIFNGELKILRETVGSNESIDNVLNGQLIKTSDRIKQLRTDIHQNELRRDNLIHNMNNLKDKIERVRSLGDVGKDTKDIKQQRRELVKRIRELNKDIREVVSKRESDIIALTSRKTKKEHVGNFLKSYNEIDDDYDTCKALETLFNVSDNGKGIVEFIIRDNILPYVQDIANDIFRQLNIKYKVMFNFVKKEQIEFYVRKNGDVNNIDYDCTSGFEGELIDIVIKYIFCQINSKVRTDFFIIDEGLKSSDKKNKENLRKIINLLKRTFKWILAVSHNDYLKDMYDKDLKIDNLDQVTSRITV